MTVAAVHLFGSAEGYQTLHASEGLDAPDRKFLETLGFGQTDALSYLDSLDSRPAAMGRPLPSGKFSLTRCFEGTRDQAGRRTLLFASIVFDEGEWWDHFVNRSWGLLHARKIWREVVGGKADRITIPHLGADDGAANRDLAIGLLDAWLSPTRGRRRVVVESSPSTDQSIASLACLIPQRDARLLAWGIRTLSSSAPVQVQSVATEIGIPHTGSCTPTSIKRLKVPYCEALDLFWRPGCAAPAKFVGATPSVHDMISLGLSLGLHGEPDSSAASNIDAAPSLSRRWVWPAIVLVMTILLSGAAVLTLQLLSRHGDCEIAEPAESQPTQAILRVTPTLEQLLARHADRSNWTFPQLVSWMNDAEKLKQIHPKSAELSAAAAECNRMSEWYAFARQWIGRVTRVIGEVDSAGGALPDRDNLVSLDAAIREGASIVVEGDATFSMLRSEVLTVINRRLHEAQLLREAVEEHGVAQLKPCRQDLNRVWKLLYNQSRDRLTPQWLNLLRENDEQNVKQSTTRDLQALLSSGNKRSSRIAADWSVCEQVALWPSPGDTNGGRWSSRDIAVELLCERTVQTMLVNIFSGSKDRHRLDSGVRP